MNLTNWNRRSGNLRRWRQSRRLRTMHVQVLEPRRLLAGPTVQSVDPPPSSQTALVDTDVSVRYDQDNDGGPDDLDESVLSFTYLLHETPIQGNTRDKPQAKVWWHDDRSWTVTPDASGTWLRRLDGLAWTPVLQLSTNQDRADVKPAGDVAHILLYRGRSSQLASVEYVPGEAGTYQLWSRRPSLADLSFSEGVETATIDVDSTGRMWVASDAQTEIEVRYSDSPYATWSDPITLCSGISTDDISLVTALPNETVGVLWSNQQTERFGFRVHNDADAPELWSFDEVPASQSALDIGSGMADDHLNAAVASDGTLYAAVKTSYDTSGVTKIGLLVRRPGGAWDPLYEVDTHGTRPLVALSEDLDRLLVAYRDTTGSGPIVYRESALSSIAFGPKETLIPGSVLNDPSSIKHNFTDQLVVIASGGGSLVGALLSTSPLINLAPSVNAGVDQTIFHAQVANLDGSVSDDGLPDPPAAVTTTWSVQSGPAGGVVTFGDPSAVDTTACFSSDGQYVLRLTANDGELEAFDEVIVTVAFHSRVVGRHVFYNKSAFDGNDPAPNGQDFEAMATDKVALLPGGTATVANYTSYSRGINGIMVDIAGLPPAGDTISGDDYFEFKVGNDNNPAGWADALDPASVTVWPGEGVNGSDGLTIIWNDNAIQKQWLQVTVLVTENTGLEQPDVFYFGNAVGESGNSTIDAKVNAYDMLGARDNQRTFVNPAEIDFDYDYNRDARVNAYDMLIARDNQTHFLNALKLISVPGNKIGALDETEILPASAAGPRSRTQVGMAWLYEFEQTGPPRRSSAQGPAAGQQAVDMLLAGW